MMSSQSFVLNIELYKCVTFINKSIRSEPNILFLTLNLKHLFIFHQFYHQRKPSKMENMVDIVCDLDLYKMPMDEILQNRFEFYEFKREAGEPIQQWLNRIQNCISCCDYPAFIIEFLLIDRFICGLSKTEMEIIRSAGTWSFKQIIERFGYQKVGSEDTNLAIDRNFIPSQSISSVDTVKSEPVSVRRVFF